MKVTPLPGTLPPSCDTNHGFKRVALYAIQLVLDETMMQSIPTYYYCRACILKELAERQLDYVYNAIDESPIEEMQALTASVVRCEGNGSTSHLQMVLTPKNETDKNMLMLLRGYNAGTADENQDDGGLTINFTGKRASHSDVDDSW